MRSTRPVDLIFAPAVVTSRTGERSEAAIVADEPPEVVHGGMVDLGAIATEYLLLGDRSLSAQARRRLPDTAGDDRDTRIRSGRSLR